MKLLFDAPLRGMLLAMLCAVFIVGGMPRAYAQMYDLETTDLHYMSEGKSYTLSLYEENRGEASGPRGAYVIEDLTQSAWDASFDYRADRNSFVVYYSGGPEEMSFLGDDAMIVKGWYGGRDVVNLYDEADSFYEKQRNGIYESEGGSRVPRYISDALEEFRDRGAAYFDSGSTVTYRSSKPGDGNKREFALYRKMEKSAQTSVKRYKLANDYDESEWVTFSYEPSSRIFAMYDANSGDEPYAYRRFTPDYSRLENQSQGGRVPTGTYVRGANGDYQGDTVDIYKYITDGLLFFLENVKK